MKKSTAVVTAALATVVAGAAMAFFQPGESSASPSSTGGEAIQFTTLRGEDARAEDSAGSVVLFDEARFADTGSSQRMSGTGCQNVARDNTASSLQPAGDVEVWSDVNCTGISYTITGDVSDLGAIDFSDTISSVKLG
ncbi:hypothetical protein [Umezawaea beigongshangensis]|uniref:hypothetical protein n=1 Tax=Umezawaea beigongshangensis TaxID=2780383 RepID=UPI0018F1B373|nr:hypothetical protein [Umezawaea beigongshangensis]